jgi:hypothetical protein
MSCNACSIVLTTRYLRDTYPETGDAARLPAQLASVHCTVRQILFCTGSTRAAKAGQNLLYRHGGPTNQQEKTPFICTPRVPICLSFNIEQGPPLYNAPSPFLLQASGQIFKDDVIVFFSYQGHYDNPIPPRCLAFIDCSKIPAHRYLLHVPHKNTRWRHGVAKTKQKRCVADPDPDPPHTHVFGPPGSGSTSMVWRYGSGYKNSKKNLDSYYFVTLFDFLS